MADTLAEIQERHEAVKELEKSLLDLHQIFLVRTPKTLTCHEPHSSSANPLHTSLACCPAADIS